MIKQRLTKANFERGLKGIIRKSDKQKQARVDVYSDNETIKLLEAWAHKKYLMKP